MERIRRRHLQGEPAKRRARVAVLETSHELSSETFVRKHSPAPVDAGRTRLRPILMTTVATIVGLLPMAFGIGEGSETNLPLARAVIGGLAVSTLFTLFLVPALYTALERFSKRSHAPEDDDGAPGGAVHA